MTKPNPDDYFGDSKGEATAKPKGKRSLNPDDYFGPIEPPKPKAEKPPGLIKRGLAALANGRGVDEVDAGGGTAPVLQDGQESAAPVDDIGGGRGRVNPEPARADSRRGGTPTTLRSGAYVAGMEEAPTAPSAGELLETPRADFQPSQADLEWQSLSPAKQQEILARGAQRGSPGAFASEPGVAETIAANVREATSNPIARGAVAGFSQLGQTGVGAVRAVADTVGADGVADFAAGASGKATQIGTGATRDLKGNDKLVADISSSILNSAPALAVGVAGGPALRTLFAQSALAEYNSGRDAGFSPAESATRAGIMGLAESLGERFGLPQQIALLKSVAKHVPTGELAKTFGSMISREIPGEQLTTAMQFLADKLGPAALSPDASLADYLSQAGETLKVTIGQTAVMGGGPAAIGTVRNAYAKSDRATAAPEQLIARAIDDAAAQYGLNTKAAAKLREKTAGMDPDAATSYAEKVFAAAERAGLVKKPGGGGAVHQNAKDLAEQAAKDAEAQQTANSAGSSGDSSPAVAAASSDTGLADDMDAGAILGTPGEATPASDSSGAATTEGNQDGQRKEGQGRRGQEGLLDPAAQPGVEAGAAPPIEGEPINKAWSSFTPESGTLNIPREQMPQVDAEHRGALVQFLGARGITHESAEVPADSLKPTQAEFSPKKVEHFAGNPSGRSILVSQDGYVLDGHHQWMAKRAAGEPVKVIRLNAPIQDLLRLAHQFPSSGTSKGPRATVAKPRPEINQTDAAISHGVGDGGAVDAKKLAEFAVSPSFAEKSLRQLDVPTQGSVLAGVSAVLQQPKVRQRVVALVPIDVVHVLIGKQGTADQLFHDPAMLANLAAIDRDDPVSVRGDAISAAVRLVARAAAEEGVLPSGSGSAAAKGGAAPDTHERALIQNARTAAVGGPIGAIGSDVTAKAGATASADKIDGRQVSTPTSIDELGPTSGATEAGPPTVSNNSRSRNVPRSGTPDAGSPESRGPADAGDGRGTGTLVPGELQQPGAAGVAGGAVPDAGARDVPGADRPGDSNGALKPGQSVTVNGKPYTVKSAKPKVLVLTGADGKPRTITSDSANWAKVKPAGDRQLISGPISEEFAGQMGEGMAEHVAKQQQKRLTKERPELEWTVAEADPTRNPKLKADRYVVQGRAPVAQAKPDQEAAPARSVEPAGAAAAPAVPAAGSPEVEADGLTKGKKSKITKAKSKPPKEKPAKPVMGSWPLGYIVHSLGGIGMSLRSDLSRKEARTRTNRKTGKVTHYTDWRGNGLLFRERGSTDLTEMARVLEEAGYIEPGLVKRDYLEATSQVQDIIKAEINNPGSTEPTYSDDFEEMMRRQEEARRIDYEMESFSVDDMDQAGGGEYDAEQQAVFAQLAKEAEALGIDVDLLREQFYDEANPEWSQKEYDQALTEALKQAIARVAGQAPGDDASGARDGGQSGIEADPDSPSAGSDRADGPDQAVQAEGLTPAAGRALAAPAGNQLAALGRTMRSAGWEIDYIDLDLTGEKPKAEIKVHRGDGRWLWAKVDAQGRASFETFQRESGLGRQKGLKAGASAPLVPQRDDTFLGRQKFEGARSMLRSMVNYLADNATNPVALADMKAAWAGVLSAPVSNETPALSLAVESEADARAKAEREAQALADERKAKADEQAKLEREAADKEARARADSSVDDFQLGQSADAQLSGQKDIFSAPVEAPAQTEPSAPAKSADPMALTDRQINSLRGKPITMKAQTEDGQVASWEIDAAEAVLSLRTREAAIQQLVRCLA